MPSKQWLQVEVGNEIVMYLLLSFVSNLDFKPLFVPSEGNLGSVYIVYIVAHVDMRSSLAVSKSHCDGLIENLQ